VNSTGVRFNRYGLVVLDARGQTQHDSAVSAFSHRVVGAGSALLAVPAADKKEAKGKPAETFDAAAETAPDEGLRLLIRLTLDEARKLPKRDLQKLFEQARVQYQQLAAASTPAPANVGKPVFDDEA